MFQRYWALLALLPILAAGLFAPGPGLWMGEQRVFTAALVALILFISGLKIDLRRLAKHTLNWRALLLGLGTTYCVAPLIALQAARIFGPSVEGLDSQGRLFLEALLLAAAQSGTLATALTLTRLARGDCELSLVLTVFSTLSAVILTPLVLALTLGAVVEIPVGPMVLRMAMIIVLPITLGYGFGRILRHQGLEVPSAVSAVIPQCIVLTFAYVGFSAASGEFREDLTLAFRFLGACLGLHFSLLIWTFLVTRLFGLSGPQRIAVLFGASQKSVPNGIYLWREFFYANPYGAAPLVLHQLVQLVAGFLLTPWIERLGAGDSSPRSGIVHSDPGDRS